MKSLFRVGPKTNDWRPLRKGKETLRHAQRQRRKKAMRRWRLNSESVSQGTSGVIKLHQKLGRSQAGFVPRFLRERERERETDFGFPDFRTVRELVSIVWSYQIVVLCDYIPRTLIKHNQIITTKLITTKNVSIIMVMQWLTVSMSFPGVEMRVQEAPGRTRKSSPTRITYSIYFWCFFVGKISYCFIYHWKWKSLSCVRLFATPWTIQSMEFSRPEYWSG